MFDGIGEDMKKLEPLHTVDGNTKWCSHYGKQHGGFLVQRVACHLA